ncbi:MULTISPECIES: glycosyltransferase [Spirulina sp. CCY15215]|uniref:glycosyltransferase family 2 protein n=1 Tax=Spirulina sp. CCY15215 TaxID=2767591 RepID=UPI00194F0F89|nr:glycosyltransferase [Spirulina major]
MNLVDKLENLKSIQKEQGTLRAIAFLGDRLLAKLRGKINYQQWRKQHRLAETDIQSARAEIATWSHCPLFSILLPVYNVEQVWLEKAIQSVRGQIYPYWQLCIADDASSAAHIRPLLQKYQESDRRIKVIFRDQNGNISAASNSALELATGEYIGLLDHDDELAIDALFAVAKLLQTYPHADFIYTDEDHIDTKGKHFDPAFKPDWSPEYFHTQMYTCHFGVYRTQLVREIGGFRSEFDGAQDYDLVLRLTEKTKNIYHIPKILYHWRAIASSSASGVQGKPDAFQTGKKALESMLERSHYPGFVAETEMAGVFRLRRQLQAESKISIIIPSAGKQIKEAGKSICLLENCLQSIQEKSTYRNFEIVVVDGWDIPEEILKRLEGKLEGKLELVRDRAPFNFSTRINLGVEKARGDIILILNDDTQVITPDWLESMFEFAQQAEIGAVGAKLLFPDGKIQHSGVVIVEDIHPMHVFYGYEGAHQGYSFSNLVNRNYIAVTGACLMMRKALFAELQGLDTEFALNYNDVDLCLKAHQAGYRNLITPYAQLSHYGSASRSDRQVRPEERQKLAEKWGEYWQKIGGDPYYNPNFASNNPNFEI